MNQSRPLPPSWLAWLVWGIGALFYLSGFYQRVAPAVMTQELMSDFSLTAAGLGHLSGFYFYAYVAMQIPTGLLADSWGPRKLISAGALTAAAGSLIFALGPSVAWAYLGRLLIGGSVAVAWVTLLKLAAHWFPPRRFSFVSGLALLFGVLGAVTAGMPLRVWVADFGWRPVMTVSGLVILGLAAACWLLVRDDPSQRGYASHYTGQDHSTPAQPQSLLGGLKQVLSFRNTWFLTLAPGGMVGPVLAFAGLWGVPYLGARYGLDQAAAAAVCSTLMIAWAVGSPLLGALSDRMGKRKPIYLAGAAASALCWAIMLYLPGLPLAGFVALAIVGGLSTGTMIVGFAFAKESVPPRLGGTVGGVVNMGVMMGPTLLQPASGWLLDQFWEGGLAGGARVYTVGDYQAAFTLFMAWALAGVVCLMFTKETYCRQAV